MAQSAKDIRINELLDANSQLNATVKQLMAALFAKIRRILSLLRIIRLLLH